MKNKIILGLALLMGISFTGNYASGHDNNSGGAEEDATIHSSGEALEKLQDLATNKDEISQVISNLKTYKKEFPNFLNKLAVFLSTHPAMWNNIIEGVSNNPVLLKDFMQALNTNKKTWKQLIIAIKDNSGLLDTFVSTMSSNPAIWNKLLIVLDGNNEIQERLYEILNKNPEAIISLLKRVRDTMTENPNIKKKLIAIVLANPTKWAGYLSEIKANYPTEWAKVKAVLAEYFHSSETVNDEHFESVSDLHQ